MRLDWKLSRPAQLSGMGKLGGAAPEPPEFIAFRLPGRVKRLDAENTNFRSEDRATVETDPSAGRRLYRQVVTHLRPPLSGLKETRMVRSEAPLLPTA